MKRNLPFHTKRKTAAPMRSTLVAKVVFTDDFGGRRRRRTKNGQLVF
jgi:hypothetical protein